MLDYVCPELAVVKPVREDVSVDVGELLVMLADIRRVHVPSDLWEELAGICPVDVRLELTRVDFREAHNFLSAFFPAIARDGGLEELRLFADGVFVYRELAFVLVGLVVVDADQDGDHVVVIGSRCEAFLLGTLEALSIVINLMIRTLVGRRTSRLVPAQFLMKHVKARVA
jgi:hypothetical protein